MLLMFKGFYCSIERVLNIDWYQLPLTGTVDQSKRNIVQDNTLHRACHEAGGFIINETFRISRKDISPSHYHKKEIKCSLGSEI